ncbi:LysR family transcriptional regulator [Massilia eburnea]|nr:LysR family transcriptional regulator [Massilia eburnea]
MSELDDYATFVAILETGSLTAAARRTGRSLQTVSRALAELESSLGTQLIQRTTRKLHATPAGAAFLDRIRPALADIEAAREAARNEGDAPQGKLRVAAPTLLGASWLTPVAANFMQRWPGIQVELVLSERLSDLVAEGIDVAIRVGELADSALRARPLAQLRRVFFAAPGWLQQHGTPQNPEQLAALPCVLRTIGRDRRQWPVRVDGALRLIPVTGPFSANDAAAANEAVACGLGLGMAPLWQIRRMLDAGRVQIVLQDNEPPGVPLQAVWPGGGKLARRTRLFIDHLAQEANAQRW